MAHSLKSDKSVASLCRSEAHLVPLMELSTMLSNLSSIRLSKNGRVKIVPQQIWHRTNTRNKATVRFMVKSDQIEFRSVPFDLDFIALFYIVLYYYIKIIIFFTTS
jgi:hypothetical protein